MITVKKPPRGKCSVAGCDNEIEILKHQLCEKHYTRLLRHGDPEFTHRIWTHSRNNPPLVPIEERFFALTERRAGCLEWIGTRNAKGYGRFGLDSWMVYAHRAAWELQMGPIPDGLQVMHWCDNPPCVWLPHLSLGTAKENLQQAKDKGHLRPPRGEDCHNAKLTWEQVDEILHLWETTELTQAELGRRFGIHNSTICRILKNQRWVR